ncbi:MAG: type II secretion system protein GspC [Gammaproteobacteria bacterium]|nr:type II secretion system protein GspC [Gammaproteobacteria bacterium]
MMPLTGWNSAILSRVQARSLERGAPAFTALLVILLAYTLAPLTWRVWPAAPQAEPPPRFVVQTAVQRQPQAGAQIADWHLFGVLQAEQDAALPPETPLNLTLRGVFASEDAQKAYAIIADAQGKEDGYRLGAELAGGVVLKEIYPDRVILARGGRSETLSLPNERLPNTAPASPGLIQPPTPQIASVPPPVPAVAAAAPGTSAAAPDNSLVLRNYRDALKANPQSMMGLIPLEPVQAGGKVSGYRLLGGGDPALLGRFGLAAGDVVTAVNGITLDSAAKGAEVVKNLATAHDLSLLILRNGEQKSFSYHAGEQ